MLTSKKIGKSEKKGDKGGYGLMKDSRNINSILRCPFMKHRVVLHPFTGIWLQIEFICYRGTHESFMKISRGGF